MVVKLSINSSTNLQNASGEKIGTTNKIVEVAELIDGDIAGLVECLGSKRKMERSISTVGGGVEVFVVNMVNFEIMLKQVPKTFKLVEKVVQKRKQWEKVSKGGARSKGWEERLERSDSKSIIPPFYIINDLLIVVSSDRTDENGLRRKLPNDEVFPPRQRRRDEQVQALEGEHNVRCRVQGVEREEERPLSPAQGGEEQLQDCSHEAQG